MAQKATARRVEENAGGQPSLEKARIHDFLPDLRQGILEILTSGAPAEKKEVVEAVCDAKRLELEDGQVIVDEAMYGQMLSAVGREYDEIEQNLKSEREKLEKEKAVVEVESIVLELEKLMKDVQEKKQSYQDVAQRIRAHFEKLIEKWNDACENENMTESRFAELHGKIEKLEEYFAIEEDKIEKLLAEAGRAADEAAYAIAGEGAKNAKKIEEKKEEPKEKPEPMESETPPTEPPTPEKEKIKNIDLPASLLTEILLERPDDFKDMMRAVYNHALEGGGEVKIKMLLKGLFAKEPSEELLKQLAKYGISDWAEFNDALKGEIGDKVSVVLGEMIKEQVNRDVARVISRWKNMWALKGEVGKSIGMNAVLVSGGVISLNILTNLADKYTAGFGSTLLGAGDSMRRAAVGGFVGGTIRGWLQQKVFGTKEAQEKSASKIQAMQGASAKEMVGDLMSEGYDEINIGERINEMGGVLAQVLRTSSQTETEGEPKELGDLSHNARAQYLEIIKQLEDSGENPEEKEKRELILLLAKLEKAGEENVGDWADRKKGEVPVAIKILGGSLEKFFGAMGGKSSKYPKLIAGAVGALVGIGFCAASLKARLILGGAGGVLQGIESARDKLGKKAEEEAIANLNVVLESANRDLQELVVLQDAGRSDFFIEEQIGVLQKEVEYFRVMARGEKDKEAALALAKNPTLSARVDNFIYEAEKKINQRELQKETQKEKRLAKLITRLEEAGENVARESKKKKTAKEVWDKINKTWGEYGIRMLVGGAVGAGAAAALGWGFLKGKAAAMGWLKGGDVDAVTGASAKSNNADITPPEPEAKGGGMPVSPPEPEAKPAPVEIPLPPKPAPSAPVEIAPEPTPEPIPEPVPEVPHHTGDFDFAHPEYDNTIGDFAKAHSITTDEFDYLKDLTEKFPEVNNRGVLEKVLGAAEYHDGKHSASPDVYKGTINTPIEAAADSRFSTFDAILRAGGTKRAVEFLKLQDFNEHDLRGNLKLTGSLKGDELDGKLEELVKAYQNGDNKAGKRVFDALRHDQNRVIAAYEVVDKKGIGHLPIKSAGKGLDPRVLGEHNGKLLVGQAKGQGIKWEAPMTKPLEGDIQPREFEFDGNKAHLGDAGKEFVPNEKGEMWSEAEVDKPKAVVEVDQQTADLIKARAGNAGHFQETIKQPDGHVIEYNFDAGTGEVIAYDVTADLASHVGAGAGVGSAAIGSVVEHAIPSHTQHAPRPIPISELWDAKSPSATTSQGGGGGGGSGGGGGVGASGGAGVVEQAKGGGGGVPRVDSPSPTSKPILSAEQKQMADYLEKTGSEARGRTEVTDKTGKTHWQEEKVGKTVGQKTVESAIDSALVKEEYSQALSGVKAELQDRLLGLIMDDSRTQRQGNEIMSLLDREIINASAGSKVDSSLLEIIKQNSGSGQAGLYEKVIGGLSNKLSLEQDFLLEGVPEVFKRDGSVLVSAATDAPTHLLKYHLDDGWHVAYDPKLLYSLSGKKLQIFDAQTGEPFEGQWQPPYRK